MPWQTWLIAWGRELGRTNRACQHEQNKKLDGTTSQQSMISFHAGRQEARNALCDLAAEAGNIGLLFLGQNSHHKSIVNAHFSRCSRTKSEGNTGRMVQNTHSPRFGTKLEEDRGGHSFSMFWVGGQRLSTLWEVSASKMNSVGVVVVVAIVTMEGEVFF
jgi:hypothetical protein